MTEIQNFDELSETAKYLITSTIGRLDVWPEDGGTPDFAFSIGGHEIDPTEFFCNLADKVDEAVETRVTARAGFLLDDFFGDAINDLREARQEFGDHLQAILRDAGESD